ncbi:MAG TPA: alginate lyase family protein [Vicinamibacterales bacterium]|nr:alginate lyase family protein [Vicinamibacterales bacterium]
MALLTRALRMDRRELAFRAGVAARQLAQRVAVQIRHPRWDGDALRDILADSAPRSGFAAHFRSRPRLFPLHPGAARTLRAAIVAVDPDAGEEARHRADAVLDGRLNILGYRDVRLGAPTDWHHDPVHGRSAPRVFWAAVPYLDQAIGDHKIIWEINRHQQWLALGRAAWLTGDTAYRDGIVSQLRSWLAQNPPLIGINWASMLELSFRSLSWIWALQFCSAFDDTPDDAIADFLLGIDAQLEHVRGNLSRYFSPNTHLLGEALGLYVAGRSLPELRRAAAWTETGRQVLLEEISRQVHADGGHAELSAHYHRYTLDFYLLALSVARLTGDTTAASAFEEVAGRLARYARALADDRGRLSLLGDDDGGQLFPICGRDPVDARSSLAWAAVLLGDRTLAVEHDRVPEEVCWLLGKAVELPETRGAGVRSPALQVFPDTGYVAARTRRGDHLVMDVGRHGFLNGGHAHADALSFVLTLKSRAVLIDPGTSTYTMDPALRDRLRGSAAHNTLMLDRRPQSEPAGPFHWRTMTDAALCRAERRSHGVWIEGEHRGYQPAVHRRAVFLSEDGLLLVVDFVLDGAGGPHDAEIRWHLDPAWEYQAASHGARLIHPSDVELRVACTAELRAVRGGPEEGWCAPIYGQLVPAWTLIASHQGNAPFDIVTALCEGSVPPGFRVRGTTTGTVRAVTVEIERQSGMDVFVVGSDGRLSHERRVASSVHIGTR